MTNRFMRLCSLLLVAVLLANMLPMGSLAQEYRESLTADSEVTKQETVTAKTEITEEVISKRSEFSKEFKLSNGLHMAVVYPEAVHYEADGQ